MSQVLIDVFRLSHDRATEKGVLEVSDLPLLGDHEAKFTSGSLAWEAEGTEGRRRLPGALLRIRGVLKGVCCRCGAPLEVEIDRETPFLFVKSEAEADAIPLSEDEDDEIVVGSPRFDVAKWVEEEVLLSLPLYPAHDDCDAPENPLHEEEEPGMERVSPFAALAALKKH